MGDCWREDAIHVRVEIPSKFEVGDIGWEVINHVVKRIVGIELIVEEMEPSQCKVSDVAGEVINGLVETFFETDVSDARGEFVDCLIEM